MKPDADTVQYGATPPPVPVSQTLIGLGFFCIFQSVLKSKYLQNHVISMAKSWVFELAPCILNVTVERRQP